MFRVRFPNVQSSFLYMQSYENYSKLSLKALKTKTILCYFFTTRIYLINLIF